MATDQTLKEVMQELERVRQELHEMRAQYAAAPANPLNAGEEGRGDDAPAQAGRIEYPTEHPHVFTNPTMHRGEPTIRGSAISVRTIVERTKLGDTPQEIKDGYPHLNLAQIHDALSYYYDHADEIDEYIRANEEALWRAMHPGSM